MDLKQGSVACLLVLLSFTIDLSAQINADAEVRVLVSQLSGKPWSGPEIISESPTIWEFGLTAPMTKILQIGKPAKKILLENIDRPEIRAQIVFLLGGVGDETVIGPIIDVMISGSKIAMHPSAKILNRSANLALTNITVADVIWHHGGGVVVERCGDDQKKCWTLWWKMNRDAFTVAKITQSKRYSNYPNYGIHRNLQ